jgi:hypothetical protein
MTARDDFDRYLAAWLTADAPSREPEPLLGRVLARTARTGRRPAWLIPERWIPMSDRTRQRVVIGPWREPRMSSFVRLAIGAAAVLIVGVVGFGLVGGSRSPGGLSASPTPTVRPSATPAETQADRPDAFPPKYVWPGRLAAGTYSTSLVWDPSVVFTFTVPDGWDSRDINIIKDDRMSIQFYRVNNVPVDTCSATPRDPAIGPSKDDLVAALSTLVSLDAAPTTASLGGQSGSYVAFTVGPGLDCDPSQFHLVSMPEPTCSEGCQHLGTWPWKGIEFTTPEHNRLWILGIGRGRVVVDALWTDEATPADLAELQTVIDSIRIATPGATPPPTRSITP